MTASLARMVVALALPACIAGCAAPGPPAVPGAVVTPLRTRVIPADRAGDAVAIGKSTRNEVAATLGETLVIRFESGFEVWVYRLASDTPARASKGAELRTAAEFVVLFAPSGLATKTRLRPAPEGPR